MGQGDIIKILRKRKWLTAKEVSEKTGRGRSSISRCLLKLQEQGDIVREQGKKTGGYKNLYYVYRLA